MTVTELTSAKEMGYSEDGTTEEKKDQKEQEEKRLLTVRCLKIQINKDLLPLKAMLFLYYGALYCIYPYFTIHMQNIGISIEEIAIIYAFLPVTSFIGPPIVGVLTDKMGTCQRAFIINLILAAVLYTSLLLVPHVETTRITSPPMNIISTLNGTYIMYEHSSCMQPCPARIFHTENMNLSFSSCSKQCPIAVNQSYYELNKFGLEKEHSLKLQLENNQSEGFSSFNRQSKQDILNDEEVEVISLVQETINTEGLIVLSEVAVNKSITFRDSQDLERRECVTGPFSNVKHFRDEQLVSLIDQGCTFTCPVDNSVIEDCYIKTGNRQLTFWLYFILRVAATTMSCNCYMLLDVMTIALVRLHKANCGNQRFFPILAQAIVSPVTGAVIHYVSKAKGYTDYSAAFHIGNAFFLMTLIMSKYMNVKIDLPTESMLKTCLTFVKHLEVDAFLFMIFVLGNLWGVLESYLFIYLKELGAPKYLMGLTITVGAVCGLIVLLKADYIVKKLGHLNVMIGSLFVYAVRYVGYSYISDPWLSFPFEGMELFTYHLMWTSALIYAAEIAPKGMLATVTAIMGTIHFNLGKGSGSFFGGLVLAAYGSRLTFRSFGIAAGAFGVVFLILHFTWLKNIIKRRRQEKQEENHEEEGQDNFMEELKEIKDNESTEKKKVQNRNHGEENGEALQPIHGKYSQPIVEEDDQEVISQENNVHPTLKEEVVTYNV